jgi:aryl-alcohol dehydrogenase-like predicted oxidoreductase
MPDMRLRQLPGIVPPCSAIVLGTGGFGSAVPRHEAFAMLDDFAEAGGTFIDSAHIYAAWLPDGIGASERTVGAWLASRGLRDRMVIATKGGHPQLASMERSRLRPEDLADDLAESLDRLAQPDVDMYWLHRDDPAVPVDEMLDALQPHLRAGTVRAIGASNWTWRRLKEAEVCAKMRGWTSFAASQISWSLASFAPGHRFGGGMVGMDADTLAWHGHSGLPVIPYSAQANGYFAKPLSVALERLPQYAHPANPQRWRMASDIAARRGVSPNSIALAWLLQHPQGGWGIIGPKDRAQLADSLSAAELTLTADEHDMLSIG